MQKLTSATACALVAISASASAADLGGSCCADLEERVAELEATAARKGNRKVSLTVYGQVNKVLVWHDSDRLDAYRSNQLTVRDNDAANSRFGFRGAANLNSDWSVSYNIEIAVKENFGVQQSTGANNDAGDAGTLTTIRHNVVRFTSKTFGIFGIGQTSQATDGAYETNLANVQGITVMALESLELMLGTAYTGFQTPFDGSRRQGIYYTSPTFAGFALSAGWGHRDQDELKPTDTSPCLQNQTTNQCDSDGFWDVALRYAGEFNGIRLAGALGYRQENDTQDRTPTDPGRDANIWMTSGSIFHVPTGLFASGGYGDKDSDTASRSATGWWAMTGVQRDWLGIGTTTLYAEYGSIEYGKSTGQPGDVAAGSNANSRRDGDYWGLGITQNLVAATTDLYVNYRNYSIDPTSPGATGPSGSDSASAITAGAVVRF
jgi:predicted porin